MRVLPVDPTEEAFDAYEPGDPKRFDPLPRSAERWRVYSGAGEYLGTVGELILIDSPSDPVEDLDLIRKQRIEDRLAADDPL